MKNFRVLKSEKAKPKGVKSKHGVKEFSKKSKYFIQRYKPQKIAYGLLRHAILIGVAFIVLYPILYMISSSIKPAIEAKNPSVIWIPIQPTIDNFKDVINSLNISGIGLKIIIPNTVLIMGLNTLIQVIMCMVISYGFARLKFKGSSILFALVILTIVVPQATISPSLFYQYRYFDPFGLVSLISGKKINLLNSPFAIWLPSMLGTGLRCGLYIFIYRQFFSGLPNDLEDAAYIDGCGPYSCFARIMVPNAKNVILTVFLFSLVWNWNDYYNPGTFLPAKPVVATALARFQNEMSTGGAAASAILNSDAVETRIQAACLLAILPLLVIYIFTQKYFSESIESTGITGL